MTDGPDGGRVLVTNGHPMSSTELLSQRYMRAMAHVPLLAIDNPERVLVLCYGVGNTARAATLHPTVRHVEVVDLSRHVLEHSSYFKDVNGDVLHDPRVTVFINDGRQHLQMQAAGPTGYDLITLEPPPIVHAGVAALYTTEFYERARRAAETRGIHQPVAAGVRRAAIDDPLDGSVVCRRVSQCRPAVGRFVKPLADRDRRRAERDRSESPGRRARPSTCRSGRPAASRSRHAARDYRDVRRLGEDARERDAGRRPGDRR